MASKYWNDDKTMTSKGFKAFFNLPKDYNKDVPDKVISTKQTALAQEKKHDWHLAEDMIYASNEYRDSFEF